MFAYGGLWCTMAYKSLRWPIWWAHGGLYGSLYGELLHANMATHMCINTPIWHALWWRVYAYTVVYMVSYGGLWWPMVGYSGLEVVLAFQPPKYYWVSESTSNVEGCLRCSAAYEASTLRFLNLPTKEPDYHS